MRVNVVRSVGAALAITGTLMASACSSGSGSGTATGASGAAAPSTSSAAVPASTGTSAPVVKQPTSSAGCKGAGPAPSKGAPTDETMSSSGVDRTYKRFVPSGYNGTASVPLLIDMHGYLEGAAIHMGVSELNGVAEKEGFVNLTPQGTGQIPFWNALPTASGPKDLEFVSDLIDKTGQQLCIDLTRVYVAGFSNGAFMSSLVACRLSDKVAAVAPVAGLMVPNDDCKPTRPVPIIAFHGEADQYVSYSSNAPGPKGMELPLNPETEAVFKDIKFRPIPEALKLWSEMEGCSSPAKESQVSASVKLIRYDGCRNGSVVELYVVKDGGHAWPGSVGSQAIENAVGKTTFEINADELMWQFFSQQRLPT